MSKMKVAYMIGSLNRGGAETLMLDVFRNADKAPFEMIGIHRKGGAYMDDFYAAGPKMIQCAPKRFGYLRYLLQLRKILKSENITIVHAQHWLDVIYAYLATIGINIHIVLTFHGYMGYEYTWLKSLRYHIVMRMSDKFCFVSSYQKGQFKAHYGNIVQQKGIVLYNGIDFKKFENESSIQEPIPEIIKGSLKLCMVGSFNSVRDQKVIVQALAYILEKEKSNAWEFYFVGSKYIGEEHRYEECVQYCKEHHLENIHFLGGRGDVPAILRQMDGYIYCTKNDTFGISVVEAITAELPVIINDHPVMKEVCDINVSQSNLTIRFFHLYDVVDCAEKIKKLVEELSTNRERIQRDCEQASSAATNKYSIQTHINNVYLLYQSI